MAPRVDHFAFRVADLGAALHFYCDQLGLVKMSETVDQEHGEAFAYVELEGGNLELLETLDRPFRNPGLAEPFCPHLAVAVFDLDEKIAQLGSAGIEPIKGPLEIAGLVRWFYIADPDNNVIEFVQWL